MLEFIDKGKSQFILFESLLNLTNVANKMQCSAKCNSGCIALQWIHNKHHLDDQYTKFQAYTFRVPKKCFFACYAIQFLDYFARLERFPFETKHVILPVSFKHYIKQECKVKLSIYIRG